mgnify:CR=1 FL=1
MSDTYLTVVFKNLSPDEARELTYHEKMRAASWSHALDERDELKLRLHKLLNERG